MSFDNKLHCLYASKHFNKQAIYLYALSTCSQGIACDLNSVGFKRLDEATREVLGESNPFSLSGSLPLVGDLQSAGYDVQVQGTVPVHTHTH